jgi:hypothetical protein
MLRYPGQCPGLITNCQISSPHLFHGSLGRSFAGKQRFQDKKRGGFINMTVKVPWSVPWPDYAPPDFTAPFVLTAAWADPPLDRKDFRMKREGAS